MNTYLNYGHKMNQPNQHNQYPNKPPEPPVFRSVRLENGNATSLALWAKYDGFGAHVSGNLTIASPNNEQHTIKLNGFFGLSDNGDVRLSLRESLAVDGIYPQIGTIYVNHKDGTMKFHPKDKAIPQLVVYATNVLPLEVAQAIGIKSLTPNHNAAPDTPGLNNNHTNPGTSNDQPRQPPSQHPRFS